MSEAGFESALSLELERRITEISAYSEREFAPIGGLEWLIFSLVGVVLPLFLVWLAG
jgi:hypothetical protein